MSIQSKRYAEDFSALAKKQNHLRDYLRELKAVREKLHDVPELNDFLLNPQVSEDCKKAVLNEVLQNSISPDVITFIKMLIDDHYINKFGDVVEQYRLLANTVEKVAHVEIYTPYELDDEKISKIGEIAREKCGADEIRTEVILDTTLRGGVMVQVGDYKYDCTLSGSLATLKDHLMHANLSDAGEKDKISAIIKEQILKYNGKPLISEVGSVISVGDGIARVYGLEKCLAGELLEFEGGIHGMVMNLEEDNIGCILLGESELIVEGSEVRRTNQITSMPVGEDFLGRVVDPLGNAIDNDKPLKATGTRPIEYPAPGIVDRSPVNKPLETGIIAIDSMIPIGRGQRELIIGDRQTGKTAIAVDTIINQKDKDVVCIYVSIGQKASTIASVYETLKNKGAMGYTTIVASTASDPSSMQYIAPYAGCALAEYFMYDMNKDVLIIYDDLSKHAVAYRALSLLLRRPPGREAFPGDVFYLHSRLLERAAKLSDALGGASITALPIVETQAGDISAYIPTNVISITDGQIYLESELFNAGQRPAVNVGLSVSRVGGSAQTKAMKKVAGPLRLTLAQYRELSVFMQFGSELDKSTRDKLLQGERLTECIKQPQYNPYSMIDQIILLTGAMGEYMIDIPVKEVKTFAAEMINYVKANCTDTVESITTFGTMSDEQKENMLATIAEFKKFYDSKKHEA